MKHSASTADFLAALRAESALPPEPTFGAPATVKAGKRPTSATAPTSFLLSPVFGVLADVPALSALDTEPNVREVLPVAGRSYHIEYRGPRLSQAHLSVLLVILHSLRDRDVDGLVRLERWRAIEALGWSKNSASIDRLTVVLEQLYRASVEYRRDGDGGWLGGVRIVSKAKPVAFDANGRPTAWDVRLEQEFAEYLRVHTFIDLRERVKLGRNKLAQWLHGFVAANDCALPFEFAQLQRLSGSTSDYRSFKERCVQAAAAVCAETGWRYERVRGGLRFDKRKAH